MKVKVFLVLSILTLQTFAASAQNSSSLDPPTVFSPTDGYDFSRYIGEVVNKVRQTWFAVMPQAATRGEKGRVVARFAILRDGKVTDLQLIVQSGNEALDLAAKAAINRSSPFPALPSEYKRDRIVLGLPFLYNMKSGDR